jgi:hypothetical protein
MSETEHHKGKATEVRPREGEEIEDLAKRLLAENGIKYDDYYESYSECLEDEGGDRFVVANNKIYECETKEIDPCDDISNAFENSDGTVDYEVKFYNGVNSFRSAVKDAINKINPFIE